MWLKLTFDDRGKIVSSVVDDTDADIPTELSANEVVVDDPVTIEQVLESRAELRNGQLAILPKAPPSLAELKQRKLAIFKSQVAPGVVFERAPDYKQRNVGLGIYDAATAAPIVNWVKSVRAAVDEVETAILTATDETTLEAVDTTADSLRARAEAIYATL